MGFFQQMIAALPTVATSWQAAIGYVALTLAFVVVSLKVTRNKNVLNKLKSLPEQDRARVLQMEMGVAYLASGLSPEQWLQQQRQRFYFGGFLAVCVLTVALVLAAIVSGRGPDPLSGRRMAEKLAQEFLGELHSRDFNAAYDLFPEDLRKNIGFALFQTDMNRLLFQLPGKPLKDSIEQSLENGAFLTVLVTSEFSVETKIRNIVGFVKDANGWKLWQYNWQPIDWPLVWPSSTETRPSASDAIKAYRSLSEHERAASLPDRFRGNVTGSTPGWKLVVNGVTKEHDEYRCTINATEPDSSIAVELKHVVGGCKLPEGSRILVNALISGINSSGIELDGIRYFPAN